MRILGSWLGPWIVTACAIGAAAGSAQAQRRDSLDAPYWAAKLMLGLGGEVDVETSVAGVGFGGEDDLELTWGGGLQYMHPLHRYFALGGALSLQSWQSDGFENADLDRNLLVDLALVPQGKVQLSRDLELYASLPLGLSLNSLGEDQVGTAEIDNAIGFAISLLLGVRFALSEDVGLLAELGYTAHSYEHEVSTPVGDGDFDLSLTQVALHFGVWF